MECCLQPRCGIDEKDCVIDEISFMEFGKERLGNRLISRRRELKVQQAVRSRIDSSAQPEAFVVELDHGLVNGDVIGFAPSRGCKSAFWTQYERSFDSVRHPTYTETVSESDIPARWSWIPSFIAGSGVASRSRKSNSKQSLPPLRRAVSSIDHSQIAPPHFSSLSEHRPAGGLYIPHLSIKPIRCRTQLSPSSRELVRICPKGNAEYRARSERGSPTTLLIRPSDWRRVLIF
jgi:hypothetical protein